MKNKIESIQALRGLASFVVMLFHYRFYLRAGDHTGNTIWDSLLGWGLVGVDLFFVLSGFIMVITTINYPASFNSSVKFFSARLMRIIPTYYFTLLLSFVFGGAMSIFHYTDKTQDLLSALTFTPYSAEFSPQYIDINSGLNPVRWTLNYELYFYLLFSVALLFKKRVSFLISVILTLSLIVPYLAYQTLSLNPSNSDTNNPMHGFLSNPIMIEFVIGAIIGVIYTKTVKFNKRFGRVFFIFSMVISLGVIYGIYTESLKGLSVFTAIAFSALILLFSLSDTIAKKIIPRCISYLGDISFPLYLIHLPVGNLVFKYFHPSNTDSLHTIPYVFLSVVVSILLSAILHKHIEINITNHLRKKFI